MGLATTMLAEGCTEGEILQAYQEQQITVAPGVRGLQNSAARSLGWREKPERIAALARLTVVGLRVSAVIQRQIHLSLRAHQQHVPGKKGPTTTPTAAVVFALFAPVMRVHVVIDKTTSLQHLLLCTAVDIAPAWYQGVAAEQNSLPRTTPP
jgi:hypothetical protein